MTSSQNDLSHVTWTFWTQAGNTCFHNNDYPKAKSYYLQALRFAEQSLQASEQSRHNSGSIHLYVVSCHNLASVQAQQGEVSIAESTLHQAYHRLLKLMVNTDLPLQFRLEAYQGFFMAFRHLIDFYQPYEPCSARDALINHAKPLALSFLRQLEPVTPPTLES